MHLQRKGLSLSIKLSWLDVHNVVLYNVLKINVFYNIFSILPCFFYTFVSESLTGWGISGGDDVLPSASERPTEWS